MSVMTFAELTLKHLVQQGKLPADFLFRALDIDSEQREAITVQDVGAAMGLNEPSGHPVLNATQELPACVHVPTLEVQKSTADSYSRNGLSPFGHARSITEGRLKTT